MGRVKRRGNKELIKDLNRALIINQIYTNGPISRTDVARNTELSLSTMTHFVSELLNEGLVHEVGTASSQGGRKPILLKINALAGYVIGIKIEVGGIDICYANLNAEILHKLTLSYTHENAEDLIASLIAGIEASVPAQLKHTRCFGIGVAISGFVHREKKRVIYSPLLHWNQVDFSVIGDHFQAPLYIDNDANVFALAEMWAGNGKDLTHFIGVTVGIGIGAGVIIDKSLYLGQYGGAGEFGHIVIDRGGEPCYCGQRGCLELYASDRFLLAETEGRRTGQSRSELIQWNEEKLNEIYLAAGKGDAEARSLLFKQGVNLGTGLISLVNLFNPEALIIGGEGLKGMPYLLEGILKSLDESLANKYSANKDVPKLQIRMSELGDDVWLIGACSLVLHDLFKTPI